MEGDSWEPVPCSGERAAGFRGGVQPLFDILEKFMFSLNMSHRLCAARAGLDFRAWREAGGGAEAPSSCRSFFLTPPGTAALSLLPFSLSPGPLPASGPTSCFLPTGGVRVKGAPPTLEGALHSQLRQSKSCPLRAQAWSLASAV